MNCQLLVGCELSIPKACWVVAGLSCQKLVETRAVRGVLLTMGAYPRCHTWLMLEG